MERPVRLVILLLVLVLFLPLFQHGRDGSPLREPAAFFHYSGGLSIVRVVGPDGHNSIRRVNDGLTVADVINMTVVGSPEIRSSADLLNHQLVNGDLVELRRIPSNSMDILIKHLTIREKMVLGIPLAPDEMTSADWELLPGIGRALAERITSDRQLNGDFGSLDAVKRVPGVGDAKIALINKFFLSK